MSASELPAFVFENTAEEVATALKEEIKGKNVLITGTSLNGIGFEAAQAIAKYANLVVITGHNEERLKRAESALNASHPAATIRTLTLDLSSLSSVRTAAAEVLTYPEPIHVLVNNAAAPIAPFALTPDGLERQIAVAHVGPFLFTKLITPKLLAGGTGWTPRVVVTSSGAHRYGPGIDLAHIRTPEAAKHNLGVAYTQAKSANILFASELTRRAGGRVLGYSLHPGIIMTTFNEQPGAIEVLKGLKIISPDGTPNTKDFRWKTIPQGAATTVAAAFDPRLVASPGAYLDDSKIATPQVAPHTSDPVNAAQLWATTEEIVGEKFEF
ncbi:hypothetical protein HMN09_00132400 [Mycena chlorophos]|uniref:NAD(P)-binding protein n=1 Tax=Mycena chlorophos TaxID=658473 RepID=A0A8H6WJ44_MYCCL|nr:hypothetical protein HMN09_00132400 [Mycena chlorophos]